MPNREIGERVVEMNPNHPNVAERPLPCGTLVLMGSGELSPSMVEVHKSLLQAKGPHASAVFLDTPAGFQLNADEISRRAQEYFRSRVGRPLTTASLKSREAMDTIHGRQALALLESADYILMGPGSPTYATRQWIGSPVPAILRSRLENGAVVTAASAAALTVGWKTLPVYEIYKVGMDLHWADGMDLLGPWGFRLVVVPHWNNAEGGTHDTRCCYMGEVRFRVLESLLSEDAVVVGIDEHTALVMDFATGEATVRGVGTVTLRRIRRASSESVPRESAGTGPHGSTSETVFASGERFCLDVLRPSAGGVCPGEAETPSSATARPTPFPSSVASPTHPQEMDAGPRFWEEVRRLEALFEHGLKNRSPEETARALLDLDRLLWEGAERGAAPEELSQGRETFREWLVHTGLRLALTTDDRRRVLEPFAEALVRLRQAFRERRLWEAADAIRSLLADHGVGVDDTPLGPRLRWADDRDAPL